ncbi:hypothetical protein A2872_03095 [Candidatus Gottesmanbacteria bacterium RIFCSPHIGHO2_01_FULL_42_12]|uniref:YggT family protein n=1 Tax=Candidatus Gottesmanbacteria bacterium RIFCSPHIGHO2_01_FULL_42_12 TaxID=1798377 RepID=A0A1F5Z0E9_9BACT|nr:MAG: hypothetical protein A2872_03095 [Candidatus Gottesmanbacteria bacterium RIFCSPHIGHO2_01_FULL_42_12]
MRKKAIFRAYQVIWYGLGVVEVLLFFRFSLKLLAANSGSPFVSWVYSLSAPLVRPFLGIFPVVATGGLVFEQSTLLAMAVYAVIAYGLVYLFQLVKPVDSDEVEQAVDNP